MKDYEKLRKLLNKRHKTLCRLHDLCAVLEIDEDTGNISDDRVMTDKIREDIKLKKLERKIGKIIECNVRDLVC